MTSAPDIDHIRKELNELPFRDGQREVFVGTVSELFVNESEQAIENRLGQLEQELQSHSLTLTRHGIDRDLLFVAQEFRGTDSGMTWMAEGMNWVSKITTIALEMVLPGSLGLWLDTRFGTRFLALLGFALGVPLGIWHLIAMTKYQSGKGEAKQ